MIEQLVDGEGHIRGHQQRRNLITQGLILRDRSPKGLEYRDLMGGRLEESSLPFRHGEGWTWGVDQVQLA